MSETLNIASYSPDQRARLLSNFACTPFDLDGQRCQSVEGFWQGLKWPEGSAERARCFGLSGLEAKLSGNGAPAITTISWMRRTIRMGSPEHHALAKRAMRAKLDQNPEVRAALLATDRLVLTHELVEPDGSPTPDSKNLPKAVFCRIWSELRAEIAQNEAADERRGSIHRDATA